MPYASVDELPAAVQKLPTHAQAIWMAAFNSAEKQYDDEQRAFATAWAAIKTKYEQNADGDWVAKAMPQEQATICKIDTARRLVFGWASVAIRKDGEQIEDWQGDLIDPPDLEDAAYEFVLHFGEANAEHTGETIGHLVESLVVTKEKLQAMGLPDDALPQGWWIGFFLPDDTVWSRVQAGDYRMFSIEGTGVREEA